MEIPNGWDPRPYQLPAWRALQAGKKRGLMVWHRRAGKDSFGINWTACEALERTGVYWHMAPTQKQVRKIIWDNVDAAGRRVIDQAWPEPLRKGTNGQEMKIELVNGSIWQCVGSDNYNSLVGANPVGVIFSEYSLADPAAWNYLRPILAENGGWALFLYTPRGRNHAYQLHQQVKDNPDWFAQVLTADATGAITPEAIQAERRAGMDEDLIQQEFYCSYDAANPGAYYAAQIQAAYAEGRVGRVPIAAGVPCETWWDLGMDDATTIWVTQTVVREIRCVAYYEAQGEALAHYADWLHGWAAERKLRFVRHGMPHDVEVRELGTGRSRKEVCEDELRLTPIEVAPRLPIYDGIEAVRRLLAQCWFDEEACGRGLAALTEYTKSYDERQGVFQQRPLHNWACLAGETELLTRTGMCQIMSLPETGEVMTQCGWKPYINPHVTRRNAPLVEVRFSDGHWVRCTEDHLFLTAHGWRFAGDLQPTTEIQSCWTHSSNTGTEGSTGSSRSNDTSAAAGSPFIVQFGRRFSDLCRRVATFITGTETSRTIPFVTSSAFLPESICHWNGSEARAGSPRISQKTPGPHPRHGMHRNRAASGIGGMHNAPSHGSSGSASRGSAWDAVRRSIASFVQMVSGRSTAPRTARLLTIASVRRLNETADVWCLTVPDTGHFALANGAIVHNSHGADAFRTLATLHEGRERLRSEAVRDRYRPARPTSWMAS